MRENTDTRKTPNMETFLAVDNICKALRLTKKKSKYALKIKDRSKNKVAFRIPKILLVQNEAIFS